MLGCHRRRPDHRRPEKLAEVFGSLVVAAASRAGSRTYWPCVPARAAEGLFGERTSTASAAKESDRMLYRETGQFKTSYAADQQIFPIRQDRIGVMRCSPSRSSVVPMFASEYWLKAILIPF